jgi:type IV secretory pathway TrbL component
VLAAIVKIGWTLSSQFTTGFSGTTNNAMAIVMAALFLFGLGIFGASIDNSLGCPSLAQALRPETVLPLLARPLL